MPRSKQYEYLTWRQDLMSKWPDYCKVIGFIEGKDGSKYAIPAVKTLLLALKNPKVMRFCMGEKGWHQYREKIRKREADFEMRRYRKSHTGENSPEYREWVEKVYRSGLRLQARSVKQATLKELKSQLQQAKKRIYRYKKTGKVMEEGREAERIRKLEEKIQVASRKTQAASRKTQVARHKLQDTSRKTQVARHKTQDNGVGTGPRSYRTYRTYKTHKTYRRKRGNRRCGAGGKK